MPAQFRYHLLVKYLTLSATVLSAAVLCVALTSAQTIQPATLVLRNGKIVTVDAAHPEAQAIAVRGDRIEAVGTNEAIQRYIGPATQVIDLRGQLAIPGLIESHGHFMGLRPVEDDARPDGREELGRDRRDGGGGRETGASPASGSSGAAGTRRSGAVVPQAERRGLPVSRCAEQGVAEQPGVADARQRARVVRQRQGDGALELTAETQNPSGGEILKDAAGRPIGLLRETASGLASRALEAWRAKKTAEERIWDARRQIELAAKAGLEAGVTSFQDAGSNFTTIDLLKKAAAEGKLGIRLWVMVRDSNDNLRAKMAQYKAVGLNDNHLTIAAIKVTADGALGSRGAWLLAPYADSASSVGLPTDAAREHCRDGAKIAADNGVQLCMHAIGDRANREVLNVYERLFKHVPA